MAIRFSKMHGAGNDFVLIDLRQGQSPPDAAIARAIGDRHTGVGFDQLLTIEASELCRLRSPLPDLEQRRQPGAAVRQWRALRCRLAGARRRRLASRFQIGQPGGRHRCRMPGRWPFRTRHGTAGICARGDSVQCAGRTVALRSRARRQSRTLRRRLHGKSARGDRGGRYRASARRRDWPDVAGRRRFPGRRQRRLRANRFTGRRSTCAYSSAAPGKHWPAAAARARRWRCLCARAGSGDTSTCICRAERWSSTGLPTSRRCAWPDRRHSYSKGSGWHE